MENAFDYRSDNRLQFGPGGDLLRNVMEHSAVGIVLLGAGRKALYANPAIHSMLGFSERTLARLDGNAFSPVDKLSKDYVQFERLLAGKIDSLEAECAFQKISGGSIWAKLNASIMRGSSGRPLQTILQFNDLSAQRAAEEALVYNEARWDSALDAAGQGVWDHDIRKDEMFYSRMWRTMRGFGESEEIDGSLEAWFERIHPDDLNYIKAVVKKQDGGEDGHDALVYRERHRAGHYIWIWSRGKPIEWDAHGTAIRTVGTDTDTDITHIKEVEAQLATEKERLRVTLQSIGDGVISTDAKRRVTFMNEVAEQMTGWNVDTALGRKIEEVFAGTLDDNTKAVSKSVAECLKSGEVCRMDVFSQLSTKDGSTRFVRETAAPVRAQTGEILGAVMVFRDATQRRQLQLELSHRASHDSLTGMPNRSAFEKQLRDTILHAQTHRTVHALCLIDLDHFKAVNDGAGHAAGDALLKEIAQLVRQSCRSSDLAARIGGDEFVVVFNNCEMKVARAIAQKIVRAVSSFEFSWQRQVFKVGASIGIASIDGSIADADVLYKLADAACYAAKRNGRNCVVVGG